MKPLSAVPHGLMDYSLALILLVSPWLFGFNQLSETATITMLVTGGIVLLVSLVTNYPFGLVKALPFPVHGFMETLGALGLLASPWLLQYSDIDVARNFAVVAAVLYLGVIALTNYSQVDAEHQYKTHSARHKPSH